MIRNLAALISLAVLFSWSLVLSTQSVEAKTSQNSPRRAGNYFVPPPPPYTPSMVPAALGMTNAQALTADASNAAAEKPGKSSSKYPPTRNPGDMPQGDQPNFDPGAERKILKHIDSIDSEISGIQKEISKLLNL